MRSGWTSSHCWGADDEVRECAPPNVFPLKWPASGSVIRGVLDEHPD